MQAMLMFLILVILGVILNFPASAQPAQVECKTSAAPNPTSTKEVKPMSREEITDRLRRLDGFKDQASGKGSDVGAMCYKPMAPRDAPVEFVCPTCHAKTSHPQFQIDDLDALRRMVKDLPLQATLDERFYCAECNKNKDIKGMILEIKLPGSEQTVKNQVTVHDVSDLLKVFNSSELNEKMFEGQVVSSVAKRIHQLLGIPQSGK